MSGCAIAGFHCIYNTRHLSLDRNDRTSTNKCYEPSGTSSRTTTRTNSFLPSDLVPWIFPGARTDASPTNSRSTDNLKAPTAPESKESSRFVGTGVEKHVRGYIRCDYFIASHCIIVSCFLYYLMTFSFKNGAFRLENNTNERTEGPDLL